MQTTKLVTSTRKVSRRKSSRVAKPRNGATVKNSKPGVISAAELASSIASSASSASTSAATSISSTSLPQTFLISHRPDFIQGVHHLISIDPSFLSVFSTNKFPKFQLSDSDPFEVASAAYVADKAKGTILLKTYFFKSLCDGLISQQVSGAAAFSIKNKVMRLYDPSGSIFPPPEWFLTQTQDSLRSAGLSKRKSEYLQTVSQDFVEKGEELVELFMTSDNDAVIERLTMLKGIGKWSAQMFLLFGLRRMDVFSEGDLGVARGVSRYFEANKMFFEGIKKEVEIDVTYKSKWLTNKNVKSKRTWKPVHEQYMLAAADRFKPFQSVFMLAMWKYADTNVEAME